MNQINQMYAYVQIPLKMAGQNAHSDLYVYTDKRKKQEKDGELTAFLHLDLDHLGSTDVSIKLLQKQVSTNFYLADDASYELILANMDKLKKRLEEKGFQAKIQVTNQEEKVNFVENLLNQGSSSGRGMVHRYSFDVRA
jgi:flagellar hook-length control protein FliK